MRASKFIERYLQQHGTAKKKDIVRSLPSGCKPRGRTAIDEMVRAGVVIRNGDNYSLSGASVSAICSKCGQEKEVWRFKEGGVCLVCDAAVSRAKRQGDTKELTLYSEWRWAVPLNRIINMAKFNRAKIVVLLHEVRACR